MNIILSWPSRCALSPCGAATQPVLLLFVPAPTDQWLWLQIWAFCSINEVAKELEEPFMDEKNDIALAGARSPSSSACGSLLRRADWSGLFGRAQTCTSTSTRS